MHLEILFEDDDVIAVLKPVGLLVHRGEATSRQEIALLQLLRAQCAQRLYPVHRLDRATSGVVLFGKNPAAAAALAAQLRAHAVEKNYLAVARSWPSSPQIIDHPLRPLDKADAPPQEARTHLAVLARIELPLRVETFPQTRYSLLHLRPETGRRHQLRRHLKHLHHPLIGDTSYGRGAHNRFFRQHLSCERLLLHHSHIRWRDRRDHWCQATAPIDPAWSCVLSAFAWRGAYEDWLAKLLSAPCSRLTASACLSAGED